MRLWTCIWECCDRCLVCCGGKSVPKQFLEMSFEMFQGFCAFMVFVQLTFVNSVFAISFWELGLSVYHFHVRNMCVGHFCTCLLVRACVTFVGVLWVSFGCSLLGVSSELKLLISLLFKLFTQLCFELRMFFDSDKWLEIRHC